MAHPESYREAGDWLETVSHDERIGWVARGYAEDAINGARELYGIELDCSERSLIDLENILDKLYKSIPRGLIGKLTKRSLTPDEIEEACKTWGAYLGEVMRLNVQTQWIAFHPDAEGWDYNMRSPKGSWMWPMEKVRKRILDGPADDPIAYYKVLKELIKRGD